MDQVIAGLVLLALVPVVWWLMLRSWRRRAAQQAAGSATAPPLPPPAPLPAGAGPEWVGGSAEAPTAAAARTVTGTYVSTVLSGRPFERVTAHGLGTRSLVEVEAVPGADPGADPAGAPAGGPALLLRRPGAASFSIPAADLVRVTRARGQAGKVMFGKEDLVVVTWRLGGAGGAEVDSAVRTKPQQDAGRLVALVEGLMGSRGTSPGVDAA
ncbi:PH-like domain-containing protein [Quadrisphaera sp. KR29]|uniref:PH-like domain-containing protein n=1 Tax=Quadrisphaera sp. KR29 TaxID=3461391 RepID=UPI004044A16A